jgi:hypothetical protein
MTFTVRDANGNPAPASPEQIAQIQAELAIPTTAADIDAAGGLTKEQAASGQGVLASGLAPGSEADVRVGELEEGAASIPVAVIEAVQARDQAVAAAATPALAIQKDPATPTVPPAGVASGSQYWAAVADGLQLYLNTGGVGAPVSPAVVQYGKAAVDAIASRVPTGRYYFEGKQVVSAIVDDKLIPTEVTFINYTHVNRAKPFGPTYVESLALQDWGISPGERYYLAGRQVDYATVSRNLQPSEARFLDGSPYKPPAPADWAQISGDGRQYVGYGEVGFAVVDKDSRVASAVFQDGSGYDPTASVTAAVGDPILCNGDSLTASNYPEALAALTGREVFKLAMGGQTSRQIVGRASAVAYRLTLSGDQIVAGANSVTAINGQPIQGYTSLDNTNVQFLSTPQNSSPLSATGFLGAVHGTLTRSASGGIPSTAETYSFVPDAGYPLPLKLQPETPFIVDLNKDNWVVINWMGSNNKSDFTQVMADFDAVYRRFGPDRLVFIGPLGNANDIIGSTGHGYTQAIQNALAEKYPRNFLPLRRQLIDLALSELGLQPTNQDLIDQANDILPAQLRSDEVHPTAFVNTNFIAPKIAAFLTMKGL